MMGTKTVFGILISLKKLRVPEASYTSNKSKVTSGSLLH